MMSSDFLLIRQGQESKEGMPRGQEGRFQGQKIGFLTKKKSWKISSFQTQKKSEITMSTFKVVNELIDNLRNGHSCMVCHKPLFEPNKTSILWSCKRCGFEVHDGCRNRMTSHDPCGTNKCFDVDCVIKHEKSSSFAQVLTPAVPVNATHLRQCRTKKPIFCCPCYPPCREGECENPICVDPRCASITRNHQLNFEVTKDRIAGDKTPNQGTYYHFCACKHNCFTGGRKQCESPKVLGPASTFEEPLMFQSHYIWSFNVKPTVYRKSCLCKPFCLASGKTECDDPKFVNMGHIQFNQGGLDPTHEPEEFHPRANTSSFGMEPRRLHQASFSPCYLHKQSMAWFTLHNGRFIPHNPASTRHLPHPSPLVICSGWNRCKRFFLPKQVGHHGNCNSPTITVSLSQHNKILVSMVLDPQSSAIEMSEGWGMEAIAKAGPWHNLAHIVHSQTSHLPENNRSMNHAAILLRQDLDSTSFKHKESLCERVCIMMSSAVATVNNRNKGKHAPLCLQRAPGNEKLYKQIHESKEVALFKLVEPCDPREDLTAHKAQGQTRGTAHFHAIVPFKSKHSAKLQPPLPILTAGCLTMTNHRSLADKQSALQKIIDQTGIAVHKPSPKTKSLEFELAVSKRESRLELQEKVHRSKTMDVIAASTDGQLCSIMVQARERPQEDPLSDFEDEIFNEMLKRQRKCAAAEAEETQRKRQRLAGASNLKRAMSMPSEWEEWKKTRGENAVDNLNEIECEGGSESRHQEKLGNSKDKSVEAGRVRKTAKPKQ